MVRKVRETVVRQSNVDYLSAKKADTEYVHALIEAIPDTPPGGSDTQIQYNNAGAFGGSSTLTFNGTNTITFDGGGLVNTILALNGSTHYNVVATATDEFKIRDTIAGVDRLKIDSSGDVVAGNGWTGTFTNGDGNTVTVKGGIITGVS